MSDDTSDDQSDRDAPTSKTTAKLLERQDDGVRKRTTTTLYEQTSRLRTDGRRVRATGRGPVCRTRSSLYQAVTS